MLRRPPKRLAHGPLDDLLIGREDIDVCVGRAGVGKQDIALSGDGSKTNLFSELSDARLNLPNAITLSGYAATIAWLGGAHPAFAIYGIVADEADGRVARATNETSDYGGLLDWAIDLTLTGLVLARLGWTWALLGVTPAQAYLRQRGYRPTVGSARAALVLYAIIRGV